MSTLTLQDTITGLVTASPENFQNLRKEALVAFNTQGLPALKAEEYKFTSITKKLESSIGTFKPAKAFSVTPEMVKSSVHEGFEGKILVFSNGFFLEELSELPDGVNIGRLSDQSDEIGSIAKANKDPFTALNQATFQEGVFISIPKKTKVEQPILLLSFHKEEDGKVIQPRVWIEAGDFAEATFIEQSISVSDNSYFVNRVVEIKGGQNSILNYYRVQNESRNCIEVSNIETDIQQDGRFTAVTVSLTGDMVRNNLSLNLLGSNSEGNMYGIYLLNGKTHVDNHTNVDHTIPHAESNELYKGILADQSRGVFNGKIFVRQDAQKTNAFQQNNNILLSEDAIINTKPQLEIWADDVKCSQGCTVGQLDEEALFYLQARGIDKTNAKGLLLYAFVGEVLEKVEVESFQSYLESLIQERLGSKF